MREQDWDYYGRRGPLGVYEIYRAPQGTRPGQGAFLVMQRLRKGFFWLDAHEDTALANDWLRGEFDFDDDRLSGMQVAALLKDWAAREKWPGRP